MHKTYMVPPQMRRCLRYPASKRGPEKQPRRGHRQSWIEQIQEMSVAVEFWSWWVT